MIKTDEKDLDNEKDVSEDEIDLNQLFDILWKRAFTIIFITALFAVGSIFYSLQLTNYYKSEALLSVRDSVQSEGMLSQLSGGMSSMLGVSLPGSGDTKAMEIIELIQSRNFTKHLISFDNILPSIMAAESYNRSTKEIVFNKEVFDSETKNWTREPNEDGEVVPTYLEAHRAFTTGLLTISQDKETGFIKIQIEHISPVFASEFLQLIIDETNNILRGKDLKEANEALEFLKSELSETSYLEIKDSINRLIESQLETQMLAKVNEDYSLSVIDPPYVPDQKSKPVRSVIVIVLTIIGGFLGVMTVLVRHFFFREN